MTEEHQRENAEDDLSMAELIPIAAARQAKIDANHALGLDELGDPLPPQRYWRVADYVSCIEDGWNDDERYRMLISDLPRRFHQSTRDRREFALQEPPRLTQTNWDALLAATAEHIALTHGHSVPDWCDEPERFLDLIWWPPAGSRRFNVRKYMDTPAAFIRHGVIIGGREFGEREGECDYGAVFRR